MSYYREQLENWLKTIEVKADRVLDIGGGANPVKGRTKSWEVKDYLILDNGAEGEKGDITLDLNYPLTKDFLGKKHGLLVTALENKAEIVFCLEVFEYIWNAVQAVNTIYWFLKYGGIAYVSFPFVYPWHEPKDIDYLRYTQIGVEKLLKEAGFREWNIKPRIDRSGKLTEFYQADGMHPVKGFPTNHSGYLVKAKKGEAI